jgi:hypothetical protein
MALEFNARKIERNGAKNRGHCKNAPRAELKSPAIARLFHNRDIFSDVTAAP